MAAEVCLGLLISLAFCIGTTTASDWSTPPFVSPDPIDDAVTFSGYSSTQSQTNILLDEEVSYNVTIAQLAYTGTDTPTLGRFENSKSNLLLGAVFEQDAEGVWQLVITEAQDYETEAMQNYRFYVVAGEESHKIALNIQNIDDNAPVIQADGTSCSVEENWSGTTNCSFLVTDADGWIDEVTFAITATPTSGTGMFSMVTEAIASTTMQINAYLQVDEELDYETITMYLLVIVAEDGAGNQGSASYIVQVIDMPDEAPTWTNIFSAANIYEKSTNYFEVSAIDGDIGINADISYSITTADGQEEYFVVNSTSGEITINPIDRDTLATEVFRFTIVAYETLDESSSVNSTIIIIVEDINDHTPEIAPDELSISILEETYMTLSFNESITITDPDLAENAQFTVALTDESEVGWSSAFLIIPTSGYQSGVFTISVSNSSALDYEDEDWRSMTLQIVATEVANTSHIGVRNVTIELINWNDEYPIFEDSEMSVEVAEDVEMGYYIASMLATDRDVDDNVTHAIVSQRTLTIDAVTGNITTAQDAALDYETIPIVIVQVTATDLGSHVAYATLTINVIDVNDVPPTLTMPRTNPTIYEEGDTGEEVNTTITATDVDTDAYLVFSIDWDSSYAYKSGVIVDEDVYTGTLEIETSYPENSTLYAEATLVVAGRLDYEQFDVMYLTIVVTDETTVHNDNYTTALLTLRILDINDNAPIFDDYTAMSVTENQVTNTLIGNVYATDADGSGYNTVTYYIVPANDTAEDLVWINSTTGVIRVDTDGAIDAETYEYLYFTVYASDSLYNTSLDIEIYVTDLNDETPYLNTDEYNSTVYLREKSESETEIMTVFAGDDDRTSPYNNVSYLINSDYSSLLQYFSMGKYTGLLEVSLSDGYELDRDFGTSNFTVYLVLRDNYLDEDVTWNSNSITTSVNVILTDINDQIPELPDLSDPAATVSESTEAGTLVLTVVAEDYDEPNTDNTRVFYEILSVTPEDNSTVLDDDCAVPFMVETQNQTTALIYANCSLKGYYGTWAVELYAEDLGTDPSSQNDTRTYNIYVEDYNYNDPVITYPTANKSIRLSRTQTANSQLYSYDLSYLSDFTATDEDSGLSGTVTFALTGSDTAIEYFTLVSTGTYTAQLQLLTVPTDLEDNYTYEIEISVTDGGTPNRTTTQTNTVIFISTEGPEFSENDWTVWFKENTTGVGTSVTIPEATDMVNIDADEEDLVTIYYYFTSEDGDMSYFNLDSETRNMTLTTALDREEQETLSLFVVATTSSEGVPESPREAATLNITVIVVDVNDNPPTFESSAYYGGVSPEDEVDKVILTVVATDPDLNETLTYYMDDDSMSYSDDSISSITDPFILDSETGELTLQFVPLSTMAGYFDFTVTVHDAVNNTDTANIKVYVIAESNRVEFTFQNTVTELTEETAFVISSFADAFGYICNIDYVTKALDDDEVTSLDNETVVTTHFINEDTNLPVTSDVIILASNDLQTITNLKVTLLTRSLILIDVPSSSSSTTDTVEYIIQSVLIVLCVLLFVCCIALLTAYIIKTKQLTDRLDKLAVTNFGSQNSGLNKIGTVPMTNKFALEGSNPMWNTQEKMPEDRISQYSNDSDLIGIENHPNFSYSNNGFSGENAWSEGPRESVNPVMNQFEARSDNRMPMFLQQNRNVPTTEL
ncbi:protocadherin Fat 4 [Neodiprion lecontei]|uniref:Protocadherin Fat 4 n=1 Tax=Neodiprion lecontei TaxID=441921 RepID=A0A6J0BUB2_NEOLC|nr:protocadherin Fat 4 [Neodiprion lecontei]XP_046593813.1 protocadherin Fat 4 [Neodiprion lecontei]